VESLELGQAFTSWWIVSRNGGSEASMQPYKLKLGLSSSHQQTSLMPTLAMFMGYAHPPKLLRLWSYGYGVEHASSKEVKAVHSSDVRLKYMIHS
jgi:hypothetical protein